MPCIINENIKIKKREIICNVCNNSNYTIIYPDELGDRLPPVDYNFNQDTRKTFQIVQCTECDMVYTNPMPELKDVYVDNIDEAYLESASQRCITANQSLKQILKLKSSGKLLDIGCSIGLFLDAASKHFEVQGIELSKWAADIAEKRHVVHRKPLSHLSITNTFDVITLWGVIEHFEDARIEMETVYKALKPGGVVVIYTGDINAWLPKILGKKWWWFQGMHLMYFSYKTLALLLNNVGFNVVQRYNHTVYFQLFSLAKSFNRYKIGKLISPLFNFWMFKKMMLPLKLSGEMVLIARKD